MLLNRSLPSQLTGHFRKTCLTNPRIASGSRKPVGPPRGLPRGEGKACNARRTLVLARAEEASSSDPLAKGNYEEPETAQEANDLGLKFTGAGRWSEALACFEKAINLPGTGTKRFRDKPRPASDREKMTSLYNIACCHSKLGDARSGLVALAGCLELGYADFGQIRTDEDLETLRKDERFEGLLKRYEPQSQGLLGGFNLNSLFGGDK